MAVFEAWSIAIGKTRAATLFEHGDLFFEIEGLDETRPLLGRKRRDHEADTVPGSKVASERTPNRVPEPFAVAAAIEHFGHGTAVSDRADGDIAEWYTQFATLPGVITMPDGGNKRESAIGAGDEIPCGQDLVDGRSSPGIPLLRPAHQRVSACCVDGKIHRLPTVMPAHDAYADKRRTIRRHGSVRKEALLGQVGDKIAGLRCKLHQQFAPFAAPQVECDRLLRTVEIFPAERAAFVREHVTVVVEPTFLVVHPNDLRAHLCAVKPGGRRSDETRRLDDAEVV